MTDSDVAVMSRFWLNEKYLSLTFHSQNRPNTTRMCTSRGINVDLTSSAIPEWMEEDNGKLIFGQCKWLLNDNELTRRRLSELRPAFDSEVYLLSETGAEFNLSEIYSLDSDSPVIESGVEKWKGAKLVREAEHIWLRRANLRGKTFKGGIFGYVPYVSLDEKALSDSRGFAIDLFKSLASRLNYTFELVVPKKGNFGSLNKTSGEFDGIVGMLQRREIDVGAMTIKKTSTRFKVIDYTRGITQHENIFVTKKLDAFSHTSFTYLLDGEAWIGTLIVQSVLLLFGALLSYLALYRRGVSWVDVVCEVQGVMVNQGSEIARFRILSLRIFLYTTLLLGFLIVQVLNARLAALLAVNKTERRLNSAQDIEDKRMELYVMGGTASLDTFRFAEPNTLDRRLWEGQMSKDPKFTTGPYSRLIPNFLANDRGVILLNPFVFDNWMDVNRRVGCSMERLQRNGPIRFAFPLLKGFPFRKVFDYHITKFEESGVLDKLKAAWIYPEAKSEAYICSSLDDRDGLSKVSFNRVTDIFFLLSLGIAAAIFVGMTEKLFLAVVAKR